MMVTTQTYRITNKGRRFFKIKEEKRGYHALDLMGLWGAKLGGAGICEWRNGGYVLGNWSRDVLSRQTGKHIHNSSSYGISENTLR